jgi:hypothetical protein
MTAYEGGDGALASGELVPLHGGDSQGQSVHMGQVLRKVAADGPTRAQALCV